jgi:hypothetical protein
MEDIILRDISILDHGILSNIVHGHAVNLKYNYQFSGDREQLMKCSIAMELCHLLVKKLNSPMTWKKSPLEKGKKNKKMGLRPHVALVLQDAIKNHMGSSSNDYELARCREMLDQLEKQFV